MTAAVVAVAVSLLRSETNIAEYQASATVTVADPNTGSVFSTGGLSFVDPTRFIATQIAQIKGSVVGKAVAEKMGPAQRDVKSLSVTNVQNTNILVIRVTSLKPVVAADAANTYASVYVAQQQNTAAKAFDDRADRLQTFKDETDKRVADLSDQISALSSQIGPLESAAIANVATAEDRNRLGTLNSQRSVATSQRDSLASVSSSTQTQIDQLRVEANVRRSSTATLIDEAVPARAASGNSRSTDAAIALAIGLLIGFLMAFGREALATTLESVDDVERVTGPGLPVLGYAPAAGRRRRFRAVRGLMRRLLPHRLAHRARSSIPLLVTLDDPHSPGAEAYRALRTNVELVRPRGVLLITSPTDGDGKTTTVANLAVSLASAGSSVIVVDLDLRRAQLHTCFDVTNSIGVTSVLLGRNDVATALQSVDRVAGGSLRVLASGPLPPQPSELLGSAAVGRLLDQLREAADYVVLDSPPVLAVSDPAVASRWADDVLVVVNSGWTTEHQLEIALERLEQAAAPVLGVVLNNVTSPEGGAYYYYRSRLEDPTAKPAIVAPEEWHRLVTRPEATNGNGEKDHHGQQSGDAFQRLAGLRASLADPSDPDAGQH